MNVDDYIAGLPADRQAPIRQLRELINTRIPAGYEEGLQYGMITWFVPFATLAKTYNDQPLAYLSLGSQKNHMAIYMMGIYADEQLRTWFEGAFKKAGKKLDMGKSCVRFKTLDALPLDVIADAVSRVDVATHIARYHVAQTPPAPAKPVGKVVAKPAAAKVVAKPAAKVTAKPAAAKKPAPKKR